jgi:ABC-type multidrug transport system fused ATPase/permease subunit
MSTHATQAKDRSAAQDSGSGKVRSLRPLLALQPYVERHPPMLALAGVSLVIAALAMLAVPLALRRPIDFGFMTGDTAVIDRSFALLVMIGLVLSLASAARFYAVNWLGERVVADVRSDVFRHLLTLGPAFYETTHSGEVMSRLTADTTQIKSAAGTAMSQALRNLIMLAGALTMMFITSAELTLLVLFAIPAIVLPLIAYGRVVRKLSRRAQDTLAGASAYAAENLAAVRTLQAFTSETTVADRFEKSVARSFAAARARLKARAGLTALAIVLVVAGVVGVLWFGAGAVVRGEMTGGRLGQFVLYAVFAAGALAELSEVWGQVKPGGGRRRAPRRALVHAAADPPAAEANAAPRARSRRDRIPGRAFRLPVAAQGFGARRRLVPGPARRDRRAGRTIRGRQEHDFQPDPPVLRPRFRGGAGGRRSRCRRRSRGAAGPHGARAAGGRAVCRYCGGEHPLRHARGEPRRGRARSRGRPGRVMRGRTTLVIAHRLATIQKAGRILVMDKGRIVEEGSHAELLRRGGLYARLAELQFAAEAAQ